MNTTTAVVLVIAAVFAVGNWVSRVTGSRLLEYVTKPTVTALLAVAALTIDATDSSMRPWFFVALVLSLAGDVFLMLPGDLFVPGLASFLLAHVAYVVGFAVGGLSLAAALLTVVAVALVLGPVALRIVRGAREREAALVGPVAAYISVISAMIVCAGGSQRWIGLVGAVVFAASDSLIAWNRFVRPTPAASVTIMVTYHLGQVGLLLALAAH